MLLTSSGEIKKKNCSYNRPKLVVRTSYAEDALSSRLESKVSLSCHPSTFIKTFLSEEGVRSFPDSSRKKCKSNTANRNAREDRSREPWSADKELGQCQCVHKPGGLSTLAWRTSGGQVIRTTRKQKQIKPHSVGRE